MIYYLLIITYYSLLKHIKGRYHKLHTYFTLCIIKKSNSQTWFLIKNNNKAPVLYIQSISCTSTMHKHIIVGGTSKQVQTS